MAQPSPSIPSSQSSLVSATLQLLSRVLPLTASEHLRWRSEVDASYEDAKENVEQIQSELADLFAAPPPLMTHEKQLRVEQLQKRLERRRWWVGYVQETEKERADLESLIQSAAVDRSPLLVLRAFIIGLDCCTSALLDVSDTSSDGDGTQQIRDWMRQANSLLQAFVESITPEQIRDAGTEYAASLVSGLAGCGALHLVPAFQRMADCGCRPLQTNGVSYLSELAEQADLHFIDITPLFALFARGMDPTIVDPQVKPDGGREARSPIETARAFAADNPEDAADDVPRVQTAFVNLIPAYIAQTSSQDPEDEAQRQETLHRRFLRAMIPAWRAHSALVRSMLLEAAPDRLIPPLVEICAAYLDLERRS